MKYVLLEWFRSLNEVTTGVRPHRYLFLVFVRFILGICGVVEIGSTDLQIRRMMANILELLVGLVLVLLICEVDAFSLTRHLQQQYRQRRTSLQMCICINCARVTNCSAYYFVEEQHSQPHINKHPNWEPRDGSPTIQVHIRPDTNKQNELALDKMWEEHEDQTRQAEEAAKEKINGGGDFPLMGEKQYDLSGTTSYEYDVIECEDFVEEKDMWVNNMPEEIRNANPDFVPT